MALDHILEAELRRVDHHFGGILIELEKSLDLITVHEIISDDNFLQELFKSLASFL